jgi:hypothetical protein
MARSAIINARDRTLLEFLAEQRVAVRAQLAQLLGVTERTAQLRVDRLERERLLRCADIFSGQAPAVLITRRGLDAVGRTLSEPGLNLQAYGHDVGVGWISLAAHRGAFGMLAAVVSEREMRSHDASPGNELDADKYGIGLWRSAPASHGRGPGSDRHYPDLVLVTPRDLKLAIELELSGKSDARLRGVMSSYVIDRRYARVLYLVPDRKLGARVEAAARWAGAEALVGVQLVESSRPAGANTALARGRTATARRAAVAL